MGTSWEFRFGAALLLTLYIAVNFATSKRLSAKQMRREFIRGQCLVGAIFANIFYAPAWFLKGVRVLVLAVIK